MKIMLFSLSYPDILSFLPDMKLLPCNNIDDSTLSPFVQILPCILICCSASMLKTLSCLSLALKKLHSHHQMCVLASAWLFVQDNCLPIYGVSPISLCFVVNAAGGGGLPPLVWCLLCGVPVCAQTLSSPSLPSADRRGAHT